ncbi:MAG: hypothetical protein HZB29_07240 [Nitrospinae bacterium]|nr:hypothetical protein [Nitrospinota bacterium]
MDNPIRQETVVLPGGVIEIRSTGLEPGSHVEVIICPKDAKATQKRTLSSLIGAGKGAFKTSDEADAFIRKLRDEWE